MLSVLMLLILSCYAQDTGAGKFNVPLVGAVYSIETEYSEIRGDVGHANGCHHVPALPYQANYELHIMQNVDKDDKVAKSRPGLARGDASGDLLRYSFP